MKKSGAFWLTTLERAIANLQPEPALPCAARVFYCPTPVTLDRGRLREGAESYAKALASDILR